MIDHTVDIEAPVELVFRMLTRADLLCDWMAAEASSEPSTGGAFRWVYANGDVVRGHYVEVQAPHRLVLAYGWEAPVSRGVPPGSSRVVITLTEHGGGTRLQLVHTELPVAVVDEHRGGWRYFLSELAARVRSRA